MLEQIIVETEKLSRSCAAFSNPFKGFAYNWFRDRSLKPSTSGAKRHLFPQTAFIFSNTRLGVQRCYAFEHLADLESDLRDLGYMEGPLSHRMKRTSHHDYSSRVPEALKLRVKKLYAANFQVYAAIQKATSQADRGYAKASEIADLIAS